MIDPTCGSGHFLLGAFRRLFAHWRRELPAERPELLALKALRQVAGVDLNPYAAAIARFRLTLAFLEPGGYGSLEEAPELEMDVCVGDSLLFGLGQQDFGLLVPLEQRSAWGEQRPNYGGQRLGDFYAAFVEGEARDFNLTLEALRDWRPEKGRRASTPRAPKPAGEPRPRAPKAATLDADTLLAAVRALDSGPGADLAALAERLAAPKPSVSKLADSLVAHGTLRQTSGRPKRWAVAS